jgi:YidC/Oxa1 family membrane protein insertase
MNNEVRLVVAVILMIGVVVLTDVLFPSPEAPVEAPMDESVPAAESTLPDLGPQGIATPSADAAPAEAQAASDPDASGELAATEAEVVATTPFEDREVVVEGPLWRYAFSTVGARLVEASLPEFVDLAHPERAPVQLLPEGADALGRRLVLGSDTLDLSGLEFVSDAPDRVTLEEGDAPVTLEFEYRNPDGSFGVEVAYTFDPAQYVVDVDTRFTGVARPLLLTSLGQGLAYTEADSAQEARAMAYVNNRLDGGIKQRPLDKVSETELTEGPLLWSALKSKYFVVALLPGTGGELEEAYVGGVLARPTPERHRAIVEAATPADATGGVRYRMYLGPQEYSRLKAIGDDFQEVNPYGWAFFRAIVRPFVGIIVAILTWAHDTLSIGYGWVLILFGVALRVVLWPLNAKAMRAQIKNMAVQPLVKEIQTRYKDQPEKQQKELMRLYKEHGFNPLGGCLPMLIPYPFLIALFFVFQNAIELRGVPFLWLPDLSAKDPLFILPAMLALSMFLIQWITYRSMPSDNPQMKMMMWFMPIFLGVIFLNFPSGLNLYYASMNVATLPQQILIANERKKVKVMQPGAGGGDGDAAAPSSSTSGSKKKKGGKPRKARSRG